MIHRSPEEALMLSAALSDLHEVWDTAAEPIKYARMSYHANPKSIIANTAAGVRFITEALRLL
jgi:hypothetical protein